jgi:hypothetical protein
MADDVKFEVLSSKRIDFGSKNFIEVARKKAVVENETNEFISVSRGYYREENKPRYRTSITIPDQADVKEFVSKAILDL